MEKLIACDLYTELPKSLYKRMIIPTIIGYRIATIWDIKFEEIEEYNIIKAEQLFLDTKKFRKIEGLNLLIKYSSYPSKYHTIYKVRALQSRSVRKIVSTERTVYPTYDFELREIIEL